MIPTPEAQKENRRRLLGPIVGIYREMLKEKGCVVSDPIWAPDLANDPERGKAAPKIDEEWYTVINCGSGDSKYRLEQNLDNILRDVIFYDRDEPERGTDNRVAVDPNYRVEKILGVLLDRVAMVDGIWQAAAKVKGRGLAKQEEHEIYLREIAAKAKLHGAKNIVFRMWGSPDEKKHSEWLKPSDFPDVPVPDKSGPFEGETECYEHGPVMCRACTSTCVDIVMELKGAIT